MYTNKYILEITPQRNRYIYLIDSKKIFELDEETYNFLGKNIYNEEVFPEIIKKNLNSYSDFEYIEFSENSNFLYKKELSKLVLVLTNLCNLDCLYCYADGGSYQLDQTYMKKEMLERIFSYFSENEISIKSLMLFGGEPLLAIEQIKNTFNFIEKYNVNVNQYLMVTNLTVLTDEEIELLIKKKVRITVSLDGPKIINDQLRKYKFNKEKSSFEEVKKNIKRFRDAGGKIESIESTYTKKHEKLNISKNDTVEFIKKEFQIDNVLIYDAINKNNIDDISFNKLRKDNLSLEREKLNSNDLKCINKLFNKTEYNHQICGAGNTMITILPDGNLYPCQLLVDKQSIGNIFETPILNSQKLSIFNENVNLLHSKDECEKCIARNYCTFCAYYKFNYSHKELCSLMRNEMIANINQVIDSGILEYKN